MLPLLLTLLLLPLLAPHAHALQPPPPAPQQPPPPPPPQTVHADVVVYGSTVCGVTAAVAAAQGGASVVLLVNSTQLGGMTSGGLGGRDGGGSLIGRGSLANRIWGGLGQNFQPHAAEAAVQALLDSAPQGKVAVFRHTGWLQSVRTTGSAPRTIASLTTQSGLTASGRTFVDCSYEGDLLRLSGTRYAVGRESQREYGEPLAGVDGLTHPTLGHDQTASMFAADVSPYVDASNTTLLPGIVGVQPYDDSQAGEADDWVMSMCFRMCLTNAPANAVAIARPAGYSNLTMELLRRQIISDAKRGFNVTLQNQFLIREVGDSKIDLNSGAFSKSPFSTDLPFLQHDWPLGNASARAEIFAGHVWWTRALLWFYAHDAVMLRLFPAFAAEIGSYGLCADEFKETDNWPPQLYVRESVRLKGPVVLTQQDVAGTAAKEGLAGRGRWNSSVGLSSWGVDIHAEKRVVLQYPNGTVRITNAGGHDTMRDHEPANPVALVQVPFEALTPQRNDTANLLVPVCASFSHVAFSTYRLEPQYAVFGQSAGTAAAMAALGCGGVVHDVAVPALQAALVAAGQIITHGAAPPPAGPSRFACSKAFGRCIGEQSGGTFPTDTCGATCTPLAADEWLANDCCGIWKHEGADLVAQKQTYLKKSTANSADLPSAERLAVAVGGRCALVGTGDAGGYRLCRFGAGGDGEGGGEK